MDELLPLLLLLFSGQKDKTPNFTEQCKAIFSSAIFDNISLGKWKAKDIAKMIDQMQCLQKNNVLQNLQVGNINLNTLAQVCNLFNIKMPKGLDFNTIFSLKNLASALQMGGQQNAKKDVSALQEDTSYKNPLAPILQVANADIIYILTNYFTTQNS